MNRVAGGQPSASSWGVTGTWNCPLAWAPDSPPCPLYAADGSCPRAPSKGNSYSPVTASRDRVKTTAFGNILGFSLGWKSLVPHWILPGVKGARREALRQLT